MIARLFVLLQYLTPQFWLTAIVYRIARIRSVSFKNFLITKFISLYDVDIADVRLDVPAGFDTFNDFFTRELNDDARPIDARANVIVSPVDGTVSSAGDIVDDRLFQAKGRDYSLEDLLATDLQDARKYVNGRYTTIYLAPYNYHRVHAPLAGELVAARYIPGDLFSVNAATAAHVPGLFRRNERLVLHFRTAAGSYVLIFVGALNVGSIATQWSGEVRPRKRGVVELIGLDNADTTVEKGALLGWFNMGSTVIVLLPGGRCEWADSLATGQTVRMGESIGTFVTG